MCLNCGSNDHPFCNCPFQSPKQRNGLQKEHCDPVEGDFQFKCQVRLHGDKIAFVRSETIEEFWEDIAVAFNQSMFRDFVGIRNSETDEILPPNTKLVVPGSYTFVSRTHFLTDVELDEVVREGVEKLKEQRPFVSEDILQRLEEELLLQYNHFTLCHEGNDLKLDETRLLSEILAEKDWNHEPTDDDETTKISDSEFDVTEAINHLLVSQDLPELAKHGLTEELVLDLHSRVMRDLLHNEAEGLPGMYRKVAVRVAGSNIRREHPDFLEDAMEDFFDDDLLQLEGETIFDFLARIHTKFQHIHPFRDGNGRIGRIMMNVLLIKQGYPVLVLPNSLSLMFNHAVQLGVRGLELGIASNVSQKLFSRLLAEAVFSSLQAYENCIGRQLLPSIEDILGQENMGMHASPVVVSP